MKLDFKKLEALAEEISPGVNAIYSKLHPVFVEYEKSVTEVVNRHCLAKTPRPSKEEIERVIDVLCKEFKIQAYCYFFHKQQKFNEKRK